VAWHMRVRTEAEDMTMVDTSRLNLACARMRGEEGAKLRGRLWRRTFCACSSAMYLRGA
jgi:hypothetical protein